MDRLGVQFPDRARPALSNLTARIEPGDVIAVTGPSGCGKTTLCRCLAGFVPELIPAETTGEIRVGGEPVLRWDPAHLATWIGLVQQDPDAQICTLRVRQEVAFGPENLCLPAMEVNRRTERAMHFVGIEHLADRETTTLSGGEKQRLAIASILAMAPAVIVLDEPTANLDPEGAKAIFDLLDQLRKDEGITLLVIEHRLEPLMGLHPRLWVMDEGRIVHRQPTRRREDLVALGLHTRWDRPPLPVRPSHRAEMEVQGVSFSYDGAPLLDRISLSLSTGDILGIFGPNGGGKTTLLRLIAGLEKPLDGEVVLPQGSTMGMVFQHPHQQIFERTVRREIEIGGGVEDTALRAMLGRARLDGLAGAAPLSLSLGEQRRLTVMTTLCSEPDVLLLDEPFIGQDRHNVAWIIAQILAARDRGAIVVLVSHDIPLIGALCSRVLYLGRAVLFGEPDEVFAELRARGNAPYTPEFWEGRSG